MAGFLGSHPGSWSLGGFKLPDWGITEKIAGFATQGQRTDLSQALNPFNAPARASTGQTSPFTPSTSMYSTSTGNNPKHTYRFQYPFLWV